MSNTIGIAAAAPEQASVERHTMAQFDAVTKPRPAYAPERGAAEVAQCLPPGPLATSDENS